MNKQGRRNLRHARIGEQSTRKPLTLDSMKSRLLCIEFQLTEEEEPAEIFFRPIPVSRVLQLQKVQGKGEESYQYMLGLMAEFIVDPKTGIALAAPEDWDAFGIDGVVAIVNGMVEGVVPGRTGAGAGRTTEGPTTALGLQNDAMLQAALELMQGDPQIAAAFQKAAEVISRQEQREVNGQAEEPTGNPPGGTEIPIPENPDQDRDQNENQDPKPAPSVLSGTSAEIPSSDSPSNSTDI